MLNVCSAVEGSLITVTLITIIIVIIIIMCSWARTERLDGWTDGWMDGWGIP